MVTWLQTGCLLCGVGKLTARRVEMAGDPMAGDMFVESGIDAGTGFEGFRASRMEMASGRRSDGTRHMH